MAQGLAGADQRRHGRVSARLRRELGFFPLLAVLFFNVSGGPYGIEDTVGVFGPGLVLLLLLVTPLVWSLPLSLAMAELASALPEEGGYVAWVRRAFGPFWGFQAGWWSWVNSFVDVAVFPALFADYLGFWWPGMSTLERWAVVLAFVWILTGLNLAGVRITGWSAAVLGVIVLAPVAVFTAVAAAQARQRPWVPFANEHQGAVAGLGLGLAAMMWNYSGWDTPTTCLGETKAPATAFRRAVWVALPLITLVYLLPVGAALSATGDWAEWKTGYWPLAYRGRGGGRRLARGARHAGRTHVLGGAVPVTAVHQLPAAVRVGAGGPDAPSARQRSSAPGHAVGVRAPVERLLQLLRLLELQRADRPRHVALLGRAPARAGGVRGAQAP